MEVFKAVLKRTLNNQPSPSASTPSESTKEQDLLAFRTITTMLRFIQSPKRGSQETHDIIGATNHDLATLRILDSLSAVLIREHEITAVMAKAYNGEDLPIIAAVVDPTAEPSLQPETDANSDGFWTRRMRDFTVSINPRNSRINKNIDSLMNSTPLPIIGDYKQQVPDDLVQASLKGNVSLLGVYLESHWGKETFETHAWMLKTLLQGLAGSDLQDKEVFLDNKHAFLDYVIAASYRKMHNRMTKVSGYYDCLQNLTTIPSTLHPREADQDSEEFLKCIISLANLVTTSIPNLHRKAANLLELSSKTNPIVMELHQPQAMVIYNESTYIEFHGLLRELLLRFMKSLKDVVGLKATVDEGNVVGVKARLKPEKVEKIQEALTTVRILGRYLRVMARSSALETHFQTISDLLDADLQKKWMPESEEDTDYSEFLRMRKGKLLSPWESYRDWLMLMVHYFDAGSALSKFGSNLPESSVISIMIVSPPLPDEKMLPWTDVLESDRFFPALGLEAPGKDFVEFLKDQYDDNVATSNNARFYTSLKTGSLSKGTFHGKHHAEAYLSSLISFGPQCDGRFDDFLESPRTLTPGDRLQISGLLDQIKDCKPVIGVSKRSCPVCASLLKLLNDSKDCEANFVVSDEHYNITPCTLPKWLPGNYVHAMVVEFSRKLRVELTDLRKASNSPAQGHGRTKSSDTGRMSMDSNESQEADWPDKGSSMAFGETIVLQTT